MTNPRTTARQSGRSAASNCRPGGHSEGPNTRSHPELGRENPLRRWYCTPRCGRVGRRQARNSPLSLPENYYLTVAGWSSPVARQAHNLKVVGSNPTPATTDSWDTRDGAPEGAPFALDAPPARKDQVSHLVPPGWAGMSEIDVSQRLQIQFGAKSSCVLDAVGARTARDRPIASSMGGLARRSTLRPTLRIRRGPHLPSPCWWACRG
jgi:hypothetical protein